MEGFEGLVAAEDGVTYFYGIVDRLPVGFLDRDGVLSVCLRWKYP